MENFISPLRFKKANYVIRLFSNKNVKAWNCPKIKNIVVIVLVAISISFEGFGQKMTFL